MTEDEGVSPAKRRIGATIVVVVVAALAWFIIAMPGMDHSAVTTPNGGSAIVDHSGG